MVALNCCALGIARALCFGQHWKFCQVVYNFYVVRLQTSFSEHSPVVRHSFIRVFQQKEQILSLYALDFQSRKPLSFFKNASEPEDRSPSDDVGQGQREVLRQKTICFTHETSLIAHITNSPILKRRNQVPVRLEQLPTNAPSASKHFLHVGFDAISYQVRESVKRNQNPQL